MRDARRTPGPPAGVGRRARTSRTVVVGYDGSSHADAAVEAAADQVGPGGTVHVVTAWHPGSTARLVQHFQQLPEEFRYVYDEDADGRQQQTELLRLRDRGVDCVGHVVSDDPATAILDVVERERADLVVVGSRGLGEVRRFIRGSVSARVALHAPMSVLVVHAPATTPTEPTTPQ